MDMNKDKSVQYVTMKECSHQEETLLYETPYTATGNGTCACARVCTCTVCTVSNQIGIIGSYLLVNFIVQHKNDIKMNPDKTNMKDVACPCVPLIGLSLSIRPTGGISPPQ